jgi:hypothetical protein
VAAKAAENQKNSPYPYTGAAEQRLPGAEQLIE